MAIAKNPKRNLAGRSAESFIAEAGKPVEQPSTRKSPIMIRISPDLLDRIDRAAKRLSISRSAFIVQSAAERLDKMERDAR